MKKILGSIVCLVLLSAPVFASNEFKFDKIRFFEAGYNAPDTSQRKYQAHFPKSSTRYVWCQIDVENLLYKVRAHSHKVEWRYYNPDGSLRGQVSADFGIKPEWFTAWHQHGWGWDEPGKWPAGTYRVEVWIDRVKFGEDLFTIFDDRPVQNPPVVSTDPGRSNLEFEFVKFFEGGYEAPPKPQRQYKTGFPRSTTRYVFFMVGAKNLLYQNRAHTPSILGRYYNPDGTLRGEARVEVEIPPDWKNADLWSGWGWDEPGKWPVGTYRVEILFGSIKVGEGSFTIYEDKISTSPPASSVPSATAEKTYLKFQSMDLFESGYSAPPQSERLYRTYFPKSTTRYVFFLVRAENLLYKNRVHRPPVIGRYYKSDGTFLWEERLSVDISPEWDNPELWGGCGYDEPGRWSPGEYRLDLFFGDTKMGEKRFTIFDDSLRTHLQFKSVKFFESGIETVPQSQRQYLQSFSKYSTRYVNFSVLAKNLLYQSQPHKPLVIGRYFGPDGKVLGESQAYAEISPSWEETEIWAGWGFDQTGQWKTGTYRVEILFGNIKVGEGSFKVF